MSDDVRVTITELADGLTAAAVGVTVTLVEGGIGATGAAGTTGSTGATGAAGAAGVGLPTGGTTGQVAAKASGTDYDVAWVNQSGGGGGAVASVNTQTGVVVLSAADVGAAADADVVHLIGDETVAGSKTFTSGMYAHSVGIFSAGSNYSYMDEFGLEVAAADGTSAIWVGATTSGAPTTGMHFAGQFIVAHDGHVWICTASGTPGTWVDVGAGASLDADLTAIAALDSTTAGALVTDGAGWIRKTYAQLKTALGLVKADVGLGSVDNVSDADKPVSTAQATADAAVQAAAVQRVNHTGTQSADTLTDGTTNKAFLATERTKLAGVATGATALALGTTGVTAAAGNDSRLTDARTPIAHASTHASGGADAVTLAESQVTNLTSDLAAKAPLASPALTGSPTAPTQTAADNTTKLATTAYVETASGLLVPKSLVDAKGDLFAGTADNTVARLAVGTNGYVLTADSTATPGVKWAAAAAGGASPGVLPRSGFYLTPAGTVTTMSMAGAVSYGYGSPLLVTAMTVDRIGLDVTTAIATGLVRLGLYLDNGAMLPGTLILDAGTIDASTTGIKELTISQALTAGWVWLVAVPQTATPSVRATSTSPHVISHTLAGLSGNFIPAISTTSASITGALPGTFPAAQGAVNAPRIMLRAV